MSRGFAVAGVGLAGLCGALTVYATLGPELKKQQEERTGEFQQRHLGNDEKTLSGEIMSDLKEAKQELNSSRGGFAWGIREAIWGKKGQDQQAQASSNVAEQNSEQRKNS